MSETKRTVLWGINRPDGSPVRTMPNFTSSFWTHSNGQYGIPDHDNGARDAKIAAQRLANALIKLGVSPDAARHEVVKITIETTITRAIDCRKENEELA